MKKRFVSLLLTLCLTVTLLAGAAPTARAVADQNAGYLISYTLKAGDTIYGICQKLGVDFDANVTMIGKINGITNFNYMMPGKVLWMPSKSASTDAPYYTLLAHTLLAGETPATLCQSYGVDYNARYALLSALNSNVTTFMAGQTFILPIYVDPTGSGMEPTFSGATAPGGTAGGSSAVVTAPPTAVVTGGGTAAATATTTAPAAVSATGPLAGDKVSYYLAQHVLQAGETVMGLCAVMGINFAQQDELIRAVNNIANYNYMLPGQILLLPTGTVPTSGSYYRVIAHPIVAGDTVYNLCPAYGLNYYTYEKLIKQLNHRDNLTTFYPGQTLYMPQYINAPTGIVPSAAGAGAGTTGPSAVVTAPPTAAVTGPSAVVTAPPTATVTAPPTATVTGPSAVVTAPPAGGTATVVTGGTGIPGADTLSYLVIPHVLQAGESVSGICAELGVDFLANSERIRQLSNIQSYNYLLPGKLILIPTGSYSGSGPYYKIMAHTLVAGDTMYNLCMSYGLDFNSNAAFLQRLNNRDNLSSFYVGQTVYMPLYVAG